MVSLPPPGAKGTTNFKGPSGYACSIEGRRLKAIRRLENFDKYLHTEFDG